MPTSLGPIIATRELELQAHTGSRQVVVRLGKPRHRRTGEWACPFQITGLGTRRIDHACGEDAIQALQLALEAVRLRLSASDEKLTWCGLPLEVAFPRQVPAFEK